ncbi:protease m50 membrane-bound transcription factor site 2 protease [Nesidiocoris tenuis]|uniref:Membrane-bound transcription factor site-2 protease n=1 Tax=Nesidiocoris tenuis TaxID=355587 RepID=A0ABN7BBP5_9HEMI|nr:protease m50 membrane-bound transcription factor site 2 protease [Nesidiocoris tenuis]
MLMDEFTVFLVSVLAIHCVLLFFDVVFKSCSHYPYLYFLNKTGLEVKPFQIQLFTTAFNRQIQKWGAKRPRLLAAWFNAGKYVTIVTMPMAVLLILHTTVTALRSSIHYTKSTVVVELLVPGWNLPTSDFAYYFVSLVISIVVHEMGHAVAAVREDVHLIGFSAVLFFVIPVMVTHIDPLDLLPYSRRLRIYCAGVWHNIFLALMAAVVATTLPWLLYPFFDFGTGVQVEHLIEGSPFVAEGGLILGDKIVQIDHCPVRGITSWQDCIDQAMRAPVTAGFCIPHNFIEEHDETIPAKHVSESQVECCGSNSPRHLCFEYVGTEDEPLPLPQHSCLLARKVVDLSAQTCHQVSDCPSSLHCFRPSLDNSSKLVLIRRTSGPVVLYLGNPADVYHSVTVTDFINIYKYLPSSLPDGLTKLCQYVTLLSSGLAILNVIPCFYFDGQYIMRAVTEMFAGKRIPSDTARQAVSLCITMLGTLMLVVYVLVMAINSY